MLNTGRSWRTAALALTLGLAAGSLGADEPKQTIKAGGVSFEVPKAWKTAKPATSMRLA